jgi:exopolysaccharide production protein ExoQ
VAMQLGVIGLLLFVAVVALVWARGIRVSTTRLLPLLLIVALTVQALAESRLLVEGNWALLLLLTLGAFGAGGVRAEQSSDPSRALRHH